MCILVPDAPLDRSECQVNHEYDETELGGDSQLQHDYLERDELADTGGFSIAYRHERRSEVTVYDVKKGSETQGLWIAVLNELKTHPWIPDGMNMVEM